MKSMENDKLSPLDIYKGIRKTWEINPKTRVHNQKKKSRNSSKTEFRKELEREDY
jgi:hypothetical protein